MTTLADNLVPDELWARGRALAAGPTAATLRWLAPHHPDRACFAAIVSMAPTSTPWRLLAARELGCGSPATCWRRLAEWADAGVFDQLHLLALDRLGEHGLVDWSRASVGTISVRPRVGDRVGANPVDRGKPSSKLHLVCDGSGLPLPAVVTATTLFPAVLDDVPPLRTPVRAAAHSARQVHADKRVDRRANPALPARRRINPRITRRGIESSRRPGWDAIAGASSGRCHGGAAGGGCRCGGTAMRGRWFTFVLVACALVCFNRL